MSWQRKPRTQHHGVAVTRAGVGGGRREIGAAIAAGGEDRLVRAEAVDGAVFHVHGDDATAGAILHDEVEREILDEELGGIAQRLAIERVQHGMAGAVGGGTGALHRRAVTEVHHVAAEGPLVDLAFFGAREGHAEMLELVNGGRRVAAEIFDGVLVAQPVGTLHRVIHVPAPVISTHVGERGGDAALCCHRVRARGEDLRDAGRLQSGLRCAERGAEASAASTHDHDVIGVIRDRVGSPTDGEHLRCLLLGFDDSHQSPKLILRIA